MQSQKEEVTSRSKHAIEEESNQKSIMSTLFKNIEWI